MNDIFDIATKSATPLALGGFFAAVLFFVFRQILAKDIFPQLTRTAGADILKLVIDRLFILALVAMLLGFAGYVVKAVVPSPSSASGDATAGQRNAAINLGVNFATFSFTRLAGSRTEDLDARIGGQLAELDLPVTVPSAEAGLGEIRLFQEQVRGHLKRKHPSLYSWYQYGFLYMGTVPILQMMKEAIRANDAKTFNSLKTQAIVERQTFVELERSLGFSNALMARSTSIQERLASVSEHDSTSTLAAIQGDIAAYIVDVTKQAAGK